MGDLTVLVVGGAGYIGTHMVKALIESNAEVIVLDNLSRGHRSLLPGGHLIEGDMGDRELLDMIFSKNRIDAVMHFAACSLVGESVHAPLMYYDNNIAKTVSLLEAMVRHRVKYFIFSSSAAVYGEPSEIPIVETHACSPTNPYGATKLAVEGLLKYCDQAYGLTSACLRYFNAAGADPSAQVGERHDPETHLIPLILQVATGISDAVQIFGTDYPTSDGTCIRDYIHVNDLIQAHFLSLQFLLNGGASVVYNLGNSRGYSVREVIETAEKVTGRPIRAIESKRRAGDPSTLIAGSEKIRRELNWKPAFEDLETIIQTAWAWHQKEQQ